MSKHNPKPCTAAEKKKAIDSYSEKIQYSARYASESTANWRRRSSNNQRKRLDCNGADHGMFGSKMRIGSTGELAHMNEIKRRAIADGRIDQTCHRQTPDQAPYFPLTIPTHHPHCISLPVLTPVHHFTTRSPHSSSPTSQIPKQLLRFVPPGVCPEDVWRSIGIKQSPGSVVLT